jgi:hypothetical protein
MRRRGALGVAAGAAFRYDFKLRDLVGKSLLREQACNALPSVGGISRSNATSMGKH